MRVSGVEEFEPSLTGIELMPIFRVGFSAEAEFLETLEPQRWVRLSECSVLEGVRYAQREAKVGEQWTFCLETRSAPPPLLQLTLLATSRDV